VSTFNAAQYDDLRVKSQDLYALTKYAILLDFIRDKKKLRILVAGCGSGELCLLLAAQGHEVQGFDPEPAYVQLALDNGRQAGVACRFTVASIETFAGAGRFDCVICTDVLEHIADDRAAFDRLTSFVRPRGLVLITVPAGPWLFGYHDEQLGHFRRYTPASLRRLVGKTCKIDKLRYFGFSLIPVCYWFSKLMRKAYPVAAAADSAQRPLGAWLLRTMLWLDRLVPMPLGTSLLVKAVREATGLTPGLQKRQAG
jgi:2-polyprenyl-3-methyl-5-hydroxy-6-metoxy-1,4-benzoquinol methylase